MSTYEEEIKKAHERVAESYGIVDLYGNPAGEWEGWVFQKTVVDKVAYFWRRYGGENTLLLDAGCGNGQITQVFASLGAETMVGVDFAMPMLKRGRERAQLKGYLERLFLVKGNLKELPFASERFSLIHLYGVMEHLDDPRQVLKELGRVLKKGGHLVLSIPRKWSLAHLTYIGFSPSVRDWGKELSWRNFLKFREKAQFYRFYSWGQFSSLVPENLKVVERVPVLHYFVCGPLDRWIRRWDKGVSSMEVRERFFSKLPIPPAGEYVVLQRV